MGNIGNYELELMEELDKVEKNIIRVERADKGFVNHGNGCYSTRGSNVEDDENDWD